MSLHTPPPTGPRPPLAPADSPSPPGPAPQPTTEPAGAAGAMAVGWVTAILLLAASLGWGLWAALDGAIIAQGRLEATRTRIVLQHPEGGRVAEVLVTDGAPVAAGAPLLRLDGGGLVAERTILEAQFAEALARAARLSAERAGAAAPMVDAVLAAELAAPGSPAAAALEGQRALMAARAEGLARAAEQLGHRRAQAEAQRAGLQAQIAALQAEVAAQAEERARAEALLAAGLVAAPQVAALRREGLRLEGALAAARAEVAAATGRIAEIDEQAAALRAGRREEAETELRDLGPVLLELAARRNVLDLRIDRLELRAPVAGRVHGLIAAGPGAVLRPAEPVAEIVPDGGPDGGALHVAAHIRPDDIDRLHPGQPVRVLLPATGGRARPELPGRIALISAEAVENPRSGERLFRVEVALDPEGLAALEGRALVAGLPVEVQIRTGSRSPLAWLMAPLGVYFDRALRED